MAWPPTVHQDVTDEITGAQGWATSLVGRQRFGEATRASTFLWLVGRYYSPAMTAAAASTLTPAADTLYLTPIYHGQARNVDRIACNVTTASATAGHVARMGIYRASPTTGLPTTVFHDSGTVAVDATGAKEVVVSLALHGLFWIGLTSQGGAVTAAASASVGNLVGAVTPANTPAGMVLYGATPAGSALPDLTTVAPTATGLNPPAVAVRAV